MCLLTQQNGKFLFQKFLNNFYGQELKSVEKQETSGILFIPKALRIKLQLFLRNICLKAFEIPDEKYVQNNWPCVIISDVEMCELHYF